ERTTACRGYEPDLAHRRPRYAPPRPGHDRRCVAIPSGRAGRVPTEWTAGSPTGRRVGKPRRVWVLRGVRTSVSYIRSGAETPSNARPFASTCRAAAHRASRAYVNGV